MFHKTLKKIHENIFTHCGYIQHRFARREGDFNAVVVPSPTATGLKDNAFAGY